MITEGFARELCHFSNHFDTKVKCSLEYLNKKVEVEVFSRYIKVFYKGVKIWEECLDENLGNFGVESVQHIFLIIDLIERGLPWEHLVYEEKPEDLNSFYKEEIVKLKKEIIELSQEDADKDNSNQPER